MDKLVDVVENTQEGFYWMMTGGNVWKRIKLAPYGVYRAYMNLAKHIEPEFVLWLWFMLVGLIQMYIAASTPLIPNGMDYLTTNDTGQIIISVGFVIYGGMVAFWKKDWMIALGTIVLIGFSAIIIKGLFEGGIGLRGLTGVVYLLLMVMAIIGFTSTRETNREQQTRIENLEKSIADLTAGLAAKVGDKDATATAKPLGPTT